MERPVSKNGDGEEAVFSGEQQLRLLVDTIPALLWRAGPGGDVEYVNKRLLEYLGATFDEIIGDGWRDKVHPDDVAFKTRTWLTNLESGTTHDAVCRFRGADGRYRWFLMSGAPLKASDGRVLRWYGVLIDIDDRTKTEEALRESEYRLRQIFETVPGLLWSTDPAGEPTQLNQRMLDYTGMRFEDFKHGGWEAFLHPDDLPETARSFSHAIQTGTSYEAVHRLCRADGEFRWHHTRGEPLRDRQGRIIQWYGLSVDIDEAKRAEDRLRRSEAHLAEAQRLSHSGATAANKSKVVYFSEEAYRIWGFDPTLGIPSFETMAERLHPDDRDRVLAGVQLAFTEKRGYSHEYRILLPDGTVKHIESIGEPVLSASGELFEVVSTQIDVTERKRAEDRLRRSEAYLAEAQRLSHSGVSAYNETEILYGSEEIYRIWGFDPAQGVPSLEAVMQRVHPDDRDRMRAQVQHAVDAKSDYSISYRIVLPDGIIKHLEAIGRPAFSASGELVEIVTTQIDVTERKRAEDLLRRSEAHLAEAQRLSHTGASAFNDLTILYWSEEMYRIWGFDPAQGVPSPEAAFQRVHPDDRGRMRAEVEHVLREERGSVSEFRIVLPDGTAKHLESIREPVFSASGELVEIVGTQIDVTDRKRAEQALRESEGKFRDYAESASDWFWEIGPDYKFTLLTENAFGSDTADRIGTAYWDSALDLEAEPEKWRLLHATLDSRKPFRDFVYYSDRRSGSPIHVKATGKPVFDADGEFRGYRGTGTDVTTLIRAQEALRESERSARSALDGIAGLITVNDSNGKLETVNRQVLEYFGRSLEWLKNWGTNDVVHPEDLPRILELYKRAMASGIAFNYELRLRRFDGEYRWFDNRGVPVRDDTGRIVRWYVLLTDIEDRTQALARLDQMQSDFAHMNRVSVMGELTASLAHEITQPIASARNNARAALNFLGKQPADLDEVREALQSIVGDADRAGDIVNRIRDQIKKAPPRKCSFDLNEAINEVILLARSAVTQNGVSVQTHLKEGSLPVEGDRVQLQQVVLNLVLNAVEAMSTVEVGPRELLIGAEQRRTGGVLVSVRDSGPGIDPDHIERVFDAFYTTKSSGVGMGLAICRSIIDAHGGRLWADANEPRGAVFQFTLPGAEQELMNLLPAPQQTGEPHEDTVSDSAHQTAYEGSRPPHRLGRGRGQRRRDRQ